MLSEFKLIGVIKRSAAFRPDVIVGIGDDTAVLPHSSSKYLLLTTDMTAEGVHFKKGSQAAGIGHKALARNISDIAAMGGVPTYTVVSIGLPKRTPQRFVDGLYSGINTLARRFNIAVVGGDTIASPHVVVNIALLGEVRKKDLVLRRGAKPGDLIFVTGPLGRAWKTDKHLTFTPRLREAGFLVERFKPNAMIDISDGLAGDLGHILEQSSVGAVLFEEQIPCSAGAGLNNALYDGEDFELLFTLNPAKAKALLSWQEKSRRWFFYLVGEITKESGLRLLKADGGTKSLKVKGFTHF
jgi:thiamine-monophosphate kinase